MSARENRASLAVSARMPPTHDALLERYLHLLRADPLLLAAAARPGREHTLQWAADELRHTAATLGGLSLEDAEYELKRVMEEARERLGLAEGCRGNPSRP
jgi:hypothetical protein